MKKLIIVILIGSLLVTSKVLAGPGNGNTKLSRTPIKITLTKYPKEVRMMRKGRIAPIKSWKPCQLKNTKKSFKVKKNKRQWIKQKRRYSSSRFVYN